MNRYISLGIAMPAIITYWRSFEQWPEMVCAENLASHMVRESAIPRADKPDF